MISEKQQCSDTRRALHFRSLETLRNIPIQFSACYIRTGLSRNTHVLARLPERGPLTF